jgi:hypothetical protein
MAVAIFAGAGNSPSVSPKRDATLAAGNRAPALDGHRLHSNCVEDGFAFGLLMGFACTFRRAELPALGFECALTTAAGNPKAVRAHPHLELLAPGIGRRAFAIVVLLAMVGTTKSAGIIVGGAPVNEAASAQEAAIECRGVGAV